MAKQVSQVLKELRRDHANLRALLNLLDREIERIEAEQDADYELLHDIMSYMTGYPDAVHHRKEDWVYARLAVARQEMHKNLSRIESDHEELGKLGHALLSDVMAIESGGVMRRLDVIEDARNYLIRQRDHMRWEDDDLFPMVEELQAEIEMGDKPSTVADMDDPVFGGEVERRFQSLLDAIRNESDRA